MNTRLIAPVLLLTLTFFAAAPISAFAQTTSNSYSVSNFEQTLVTLTNADRTASGDSSVVMNAALSAAAQKKANDMIANQYFSHVSPSGVAPWYWFTESSYTYIYAGENLAMDFYTPATLEAAWMASPTHRANILNAKYKDVGFGIAQGTYQGKPAIFIVEFFGTKR